MEHGITIFHSNVDGGGVQETFNGTVTAAKSRLLELQEKSDGLDNNYWGYCYWFSYYGHRYHSWPGSKEITHELSDY